MFENTQSSFFPIVEQKNPQFITALNSYLKKHYGQLELSSQLVDQLAFLQTSSIKTSESNVRLSNKEEESLHIEIKRSLSRRNCLDLFLRGGEDAYEKFVVSQREATDKLTYGTFKEISELLSKQSKVAKEALAVSCFLVMSDEAKNLAKQADVTFSYDSEKFLTETITQCPHIFPAVSLLCDEATKNLLPWMYLLNTHARHMLYTEGGNNMFDVLKEKIRKKDITREQYEAWLGRWIVNIAGFRGHEEPRGSVYLTENIAQAILTLNIGLNTLQDNPEYDVLAGYLEERAKWLTVEKHELYLAHLGALMQLYTPEKGRELKNWFDKLTVKEQRSYEYEASYKKMRATLKTTPTFTPAIMDNLQSLGCSIPETIAIYSAISSRASCEYYEAIEQNKINENTPLCYRDIAFKDKLQAIVDSYRQTGAIPTNAVDEQGNVVAAAERPDIRLLRCGLGSS